MFTQKASSSPKTLNWDENQDKKERLDEEVVGHERCD